MKNFLKQVKIILKMFLFIPVVLMAIPIFFLAIFSLILVQIVNCTFKWVADTDSNLLNIKI